MSLLNFILTHRQEVTDLTFQHLWLVFASMSVACALGIPAGIVISRRESLRRAVLGVTNIFQTIPSLALFGFLIPAPWIGGIGARTAIVALVLYALLPIVRNTYTGIHEIDPAIREAGLAIGMTSRQLLWKVELPLALGVILAGVRVSTIACVGLATIAAAIGAGGLGVFIFRGVASVNSTLILAGAVPAALLALFSDGVLGLLEGFFSRRRSISQRRPER